MDAVEKAGNGHPGTAMSLAPAAYLLFQKLMRHDPADPDWPGRDRFVLSCGHSSLTLYIQLYLAGLRPRARRPQGAAHLGHADPRPPRARPHRRRRDHHRPARPGRRQRGRHGDGGPPRARPVRPGAGCRREPVRPPHLRHRLRRRHRGGHQPRGVVARRPPAARQPRRDLRRQPDLDRGRHRRSRSARTSPSATRRTAGTSRRSTGPTTARATTRTSRRCTTALKAAKAETEPAVASSRCARSSAGRRRTSRTPARPTARRSAPTRSRRPRRCSASTRTRPSRSPTRSSRTPARRVDRGQAEQAEWQEQFDAWAANAGDRRRCSTGCATRTLPDGWTDALPSFDADAKGVATRAASGEVLTALAPVLPELWGGSADLAGSQQHHARRASRRFIPAEHATKEFPGD